MSHTDGSTRKLILDAIQGVKDGTLEVSRATAMAALFKELNASMQASISAAKTEMLMQDKGRRFMRSITLGRQVVEETASDTQES